VDAGFFSSSRRFHLLPGAQIDPSELRGYYIDFRPKTSGSNAWPPPWIRDGYGHVKLAQLGLGHFEEFLATGSEQDLAFARAACTHFVRTQNSRGSTDEGGWSHAFPFAHREKLRPNWMSGMAQGQAASLLLRVWRETGEARFADAALLAMKPLHRSVAHGGVTGDLRGHPFPEEYPTEPQSHVLNGGIFGLWGIRDVAAALDDAPTAALHDAVLTGLAETCELWDTGAWSRYDLFPRQPVNVSSSFYHHLHCSQLRALHALYGEKRFLALAERFEGYERRMALRWLALARKVTYRLIVPRHKIVRPPTANASPVDNSA
jgi:heparosan-N-sulfate-glucuronate 5-epimerase